MSSNEPNWGFSFTSMKVWVPWTLGLLGGAYQLFIAPQPSALLVGFVLLLLGLPGASQLAVTLWQRSGQSSGSHSSSLPSSSEDSLQLESGE